MNTKRSTDRYLLIAAFTRSHRMVILEGEYYYYTRELELIGPYSTKPIAEFELNIFLYIKAIEQELLDNQPRKAA